jgi:hypothetical protein
MHGMMMRSTGPLLCTAPFVLAARLLVVTFLVLTVSGASLFGDEPVANEPPASTTATAQPEPAAEPSASEESSEGETRRFAPVETDPDPLPGRRLPMEVRTGASPFLSDTLQRRIALWILLGFAVMLLLKLILWRKTAEPEVVEVPPPVEAPSYEEVIAAAAARERIKQTGQQR